jgi:S-adenosylmethionine:tRNA ribosyltransferase-isomerase
LGERIVRRSDLEFARPKELEATVPAEFRGIARDEVRLMVTTPEGHSHASFRDLPEFLRPGDLLVVNRSATLPASLPAEGEPGRFIVNLSTDYGRGLWLAEPRWSADRPGPLPLHAGDRISLGDVSGRIVAQYPGLPELWFIAADGDIQAAMARCGQPIHYSYVGEVYPLEMYQTIFASLPGSAEMPSAGRPFTRRVIDSLEARGVGIAEITLDSGVSSLEIETEDIENYSLSAEPFVVSAAAAGAINAARRQGRRVIAVGTTVVRAVETAWDGEQVRAVTGFTRLYVHPGRGVQVIDGMITGLHDPITSHLAMLYALTSRDLIRDAYAEAIREGYLWHEFGDSHLILRR